MSRDPWLDNVKMTLVTLVVVGHSYALTAGEGLDQWLYDFIYFWHMPAFVLVTGYLCRSFRYDRRHLTGLVTTLVIPYLVFEWALHSWRAHLGFEDDGPLWLEPHWAMWYLAVLFFWRLATPVLRSHWLWIPAAVMISLVGGMLDQLWFCLPRILGMLPFFVIGLHLDRSLLDRLDHRGVRVAAIGVLVFIFGMALSLNSWARTAFLYYDSGYAALGVSDAEGMEIRLLVMVVGLLGAAAALALVPRRGGWFSQMGAATLVVYLGHGFVIRYVEAEGWFAWSVDRPLTGLAVVTASAVALALFLAWAPVAGPLYWLVDPVGSWKSSRLPLPRGTRPLAGQRQDDAGDRRRDRSRASAVSH